MTLRSILPGLVVVAIAGALACGPQPPADAPTGSVSGTSSTPAGERRTALLDDLLKDWREQKETLVALADAMPADAFDFRPTPEQRTFAEQIMHVAVGNVEVMKLLGGNATPPFTIERAEVLTTKEEVVGALADAYEYGAAVLEEQTAESIHALLDPEIQFFGGSTRARLVWSLLSHATNIYGQMVVNVRLNGIVPPASRGI